MKILAIFSIAMVFSLGYAETPFFANGGLTKNGIEWCEENYQLYKFMGQDFFEHHQHSIESRVCGNLYNDPLWLYTEPDRYEILVEKSKYYTSLEIEESKQEAETGIIDTKPVTEQDIPQVISQQQKELEEKAKNLTKVQDSSTNDTIIEDSIAEESKKDTEGGGCLIATAAYGSELAPQVQLLREIRDGTVMSTSSGAAFMSGFNTLYYSFSPAIADYERENPAFREIVKLGITPMITSMSVLDGVDIDSEAEMLGYGVVIILMNVGMYIGAPAVMFFGIKKYLRTPQSEL